jgi:hypothetical protein
MGEWASQVDEHITYDIRIILNTLRRYSSSPRIAAKGAFTPQEFLDFIEEICNDDAFWKTLPSKMVFVTSPGTSWEKQSSVRKNRARKQLRALLDSCRAPTR